MPPYLKAVCTLQGSSGLPEDRYVNTMHVDVNTETVGDAAEAAMDAWEAFWGASVSTNSVAGLLSGVVGQFGTLAVYDLSDPTPRVPVGERDLDLGFDPNAAGFPAEVALCLSYRGVVASGTVAARRRGRIYIGPLKSGSGSGGASGIPVRPTSTTLDLLMAGAQAIYDTLDAAGCAWVVYSAAWPGSPSRPAYAESATAVVHAWADDAYDTQRRRGEAPTGRVSVNL